MAFVIEMVRGSEKDGREHFDCSIFNWKKTLDLAEKFGWVPEGTLPDEWTRNYTRDYDAHFKPTYDWVSWEYCKRFSDSDAKNFSIALFEAAKYLQQDGVEKPAKNNPTIFIEGASLIEHLSVNFSITTVLIGLAQFASRGGFVFAVDD